jgi:hydrogen peroxide-dependent heme synthase
MVPYTLEGSYVLHQMFRVNWSAWRALDHVARTSLLAEAQTKLAAMQGSRTALFSMFGHKGDLLVLHFRDSLDDLGAAERQIQSLGITSYWEPTTSYLSVVELGLYESTGRIQKMLTDKGIAPGSEEWDKAVEEELDRQRTAMAPRIIPAIPDAKYLCFYPMDRLRGEQKNWYQVPFEQRVRMMHDHGMIGRRYAGLVKQIISGSIGFDDWEWGVDLFADDPLQFKKLIYEMRFDEVSAVYAKFGTFYMSSRVKPEELAGLLG